MPTLSLVNDVTAEYEVTGGRPVVTLSASSPLKHREVYAGTGTMLFHWVSTGKSSTWGSTRPSPNPESSSSRSPTERTGAIV